MRQHQVVNAAAEQEIGVPRVLDLAAVGPLIFPANSLFLVNLAPRLLLFTLLVIRSLLLALLVAFFALVDFLVVHVQQLLSDKKRFVSRTVDQCCEHTPTEVHHPEREPIDTQ